ncbi:MAG TPA: zf-HC2 domain-containing protein [Gemmatimonadales bacterium]
MNMLDCGGVTDVLDDWIAGRLDVETAHAVAAHLAICASCRLDAEAARMVATALPGLPRSVAPARELWGDIARRIAEPPRRRVSGALIAATAVLAGAIGLWALRGAGPAPPEVMTTTTTSAEAAALELEAARLGDASLPPLVREALGRDLRIIEDAIREAKAQLLATPADPVAQALAESAVRKKLRLLRRVGDYTT